MALCSFAVGNKGINSGVTAPQSARLQVRRRCASRPQTGSGPEDFSSCVTNRCGRFWTFTQLKQDLWPKVNMCSFGE